MPTLLPDPAKLDPTRQLHQSASRRNGKVARLPRELRDQINRLLDDGVSYKLIIQKLGPAGQHLNEDNLSNWRLGGYRDYLIAQALDSRAQIQTETAADLVRDNADYDPAKLQEICRQVVLVQYLGTLMQHGDQFARETLRKNPAKLITLINACCNSSNTNLAILKRKPLQTTRPSHPAPLDLTSPPTTPPSE